MLHWWYLLWHNFHKTQDNIKIALEWYYVQQDFKTMEGTHKQRLADPVFGLFLKSFSSICKGAHWGCGGVRHFQTMINRIVCCNSWSIIVWHIMKSLKVIKVKGFVTSGDQAVHLYTPSTNTSICAPWVYGW